MRLCFGTYAKVLILCARKNKGLNRQIISALTLTIDSDSRFIETNNNVVHNQVSRLLKCQSNFYPGNINGSGVNAKELDHRAILTNIWELSANLNTSDISSNFNTLIGIISESKKTAVILALLDIIEKDVTIDDNNVSFTKFMGTTKTSLLQQETFNFADFLAGILLYTIKEVDNRVGKDYIAQITSSYIEDISQKNSDIKISDLSKPKQQVIIPSYAMQPLSAEEIDEIFREELGDELYNKING